MSFDLHIIPECYIDTKLIRILVPPTTHYNHQKGCSTVTKRMKEKLNDEFALGVVDRDKQDLAYADECDLIFEKPNSLQMFKHRQKHHYLIFICPAMEKWIIESANEAHISLKDFELPHDFKQLLLLTKSSKSEELDPNSQYFSKLFKALRNSNSKNIAVLSFWVEYLKMNNYAADLIYLKAETNRILEG